MNQVMKQYLHFYIDYLQTIWVKLLLLMEFLYNNFRHTITEMSLFRTLYRINFWMITLLKENNINSVTFHTAKQVQEIIVRLQQCMKKTQKNYAMYYDKDKRDISSYKKEDWIWLFWQNIKTTRSSDKLNYKKLGSFRVEKMMKIHVISLKLSEMMRICSVFHVSLIQWYDNDKSSWVIRSPSSLIVVDDEKEFEMDKMLNSKEWKRNKKLQYLVSWMRYTLYKNEWILKENLENALKKVVTFHWWYLRKLESTFLLQM